MKFNLKLADNKKSRKWAINIPINPKAIVIKYLFMIRAFGGLLWPVIKSSRVSYG